MQTSALEDYIMSRCSHSSVTLVPSPYKKVSGYRAPTRADLAAAQVLEPSISSQHAPPVSIFPAPLVLPGDFLADDPMPSPQPLRSWVDLPQRNKLASERQTMYVLAPPLIASDISTIRGWAKPMSQARQRMIHKPRLHDVVRYLSSFYHGVSVRAAPSMQMKFCSWDEPPTKSRKKKRKCDQVPVSDSVALQVSASTKVHIRARATPDSTYSHQLNLNDLLDAGIETLPDDAFALLMLVDHDLYEDDEDDFCCGRAYGGSRIAIVSSARYNPILDAHADVDREHAWPLSHCSSYLDKLCSGYAPGSKKRKRALPGSIALSQAGAIGAAITAFPGSVASDEDHTGLWLARVCKTASHELGHCFGFDHCAHLACIMQSTSCLAEDARQPPYLCAICEVKLAYAKGELHSNRGSTQVNDSMQTWLAERSDSIIALCNEPTFADEGMFRALRAWYSARFYEAASLAVAQ